MFSANGRINLGINSRLDLLGNILRTRILAALAASIFLPLVAEAHPALLFTSGDFTGRIDFTVDLPTIYGSYGYYQSDNLESWDIRYSNGHFIDPSNTLIIPGYRFDSKYVGLGFDIGTYGLLDYLEFYVASTDGTYFDIEVGRDAGGNLVERYQRADIALVETAVPEPKSVALLLLTIVSLLFSRKLARRLVED